MENQTQTQEEKLLEMFPILDELFSLNYTCLRISNQNQPLNNHHEESPAKVLKKSPKNNRVNKKLEEAINIRNETFKAVSEAFEAEKKLFTKNYNFDSDLKAKQDALTKAYNEYYGRNLTFAQIFNRFNTLDPVFQKTIQKFDTNTVVLIEDEKLNLLLQAYHEYIETLKLRMKYKSFVDIYNTLEDDINESTGRPSKNFGTINSSITIITLDEIENYIAHANNALKITQSKIKAKNKKLVPLYKIGRKNFNDYSTHEQISKIKSEIFNLLETERIAKTYLNFANALLKRLISANNDYDTSFSSTFLEKLGDMFSGINVFEKDNEVMFGTIYIHKLENSYLTYLKSLFKDIPTLSSEKTNKSNLQKQV